MNRKNLLVSLSIVGAFVLGGASVWVYQYADSRPAPQAAVLDTPAWNDPIPGSNADPFEEMEQIRQQMNEMFSQNRQPMPYGTLFSDPFKPMLQETGASNRHTITVEDNADSVTYRMELDDGEPTDVNVNVTGGYVSIEAKIQKQGDHSLSVSQFSQQFPVPPGVDADSASIEKEDDAVVIRFRKFAA